MRIFFNSRIFSKHNQMFIGIFLGGDIPSNKVVIIDFYDNNIRGNTKMSRCSKVSDERKHLGVPPPFSLTHS